MSTFSRLLALAVIMSAPAWAEGVVNKGTSINGGIGGGFNFNDGVANGGGGGGVAPTPCTAGKIDLSLSTGCNLPFFIGAIFP